MPALEYDLAIEQGSTFRRSIPVLNDAGTPIDLTGWSARGQIRLTYRDAGAVYDLALEVSGSNVEMTVPAADSSEWTWRHGVYDVELIDVDGAPTRLMQGNVTVSPEVTR
jgi:hypothetical protein